MTKAGIKTEDYREITPYWIKRFALCRGDSPVKHGYFCKKAICYSCIVRGHGFKPQTFTVNRMTLGYPKGDDQERIIEFEHAGIEIREGRPEWGAEPGKIYFVIKHGKRIQ